MSGQGLAGRQKIAIGLSGITRAASGGMLGTALTIYVGRDGTPLAVGLLAAAFFLSMTVFSPFWGAVGDLTGRRRALLVGVSATTTALSLAFLLVDGVWGLVGLRGLYAVFSVGFGPLMLSLVGALGGTERRGRSAGFFSSASAAGDMGGQVLVGVLLGALAPSQLYLVVGAISLLGTVVVAGVDEPATPEATDVGGRAVLAGLRDQLVPDVPTRRRLHHSGLTWLYAGLVLRHAAIKGVGSFVPLYLLRLGTGEVAMGLLLTVGSAAQVVLMPLFGRAADRGSRKRLIVLGFVASGVYALVLAGAAIPGTIEARMLVAAAGFLTIAVGFSAMDIGTIALVGDAVPPMREAAFLGLRNTMAGLGGVVGPLLAGAVISVAGYGPAFGLMGLLALFAAALVALRVEEPARDWGAAAGVPRIETPLGITRPVGEFVDDDR